MSLLRFLGLRGSAAGRDAEPASLIEIEPSLESLPPEEARLAAAFAYLLARVAEADLRTDALERTSMAERLADFGGVGSEQAALLADTALKAAELHGSSDDHLVARAFRDISNEAERQKLLRCLYAVAAADETVTTAEDNEIFEIATEIGVGHADVIAIRSEWTRYLGSMKALPRER
jgi:uncharacterized tellurite resistance protein B-like protein